MDAGRQQQQGRARGRGAERAKREPLPGGVPAQPQGPTYQPTAAQTQAFPAQSIGGQRMQAPMVAVGGQGEPAGAVGGEGIEAVITGMGEMGVRQPRGRQRGHLGAAIPERRIRPSDVDKRGKTGQPLIVHTNLFRFQRKSEDAFYQYHVDFLPEVPNMRMRRGLMKGLEKQLSIDGCNLFDGMILFTPNRINDALLDNLVAKNDRTEEVIKVNIKFTNAVPFSSPIVLQIYNLIFKNKVLREIGLQLIGTNYFNPKLEIDLPHIKFKIWPGYFTSILEYDTGINLMVDISHKVLGSAIVLDALYEIYNRFPNDYKDQSKKELIGKIVLTKYNNRTYRIDDVEWGMTPRSTFAMKDGVSQCSFVDYYNQKHQIKIMDQEQPILISNPKKRDIRAGQTGPICLIPELCVITGISDEVRSNYSIMKDLSVHTRLGPKERVIRMNDLHRQIASCKPAMENLNKWNLSLNPNLVTINARVLDPEKIYLGSNGQKEICYEQKDADWSRQMRNLQLLTVKHMSNWAMIFQDRNSQQAENFYDKLRQAGNSLGMRIDMPMTFTLNDDNSNSYIRIIQQNVSKNFEMVMCILSNNRKDRYDALKKTMCCKTPIPSQVMLAKTINKPQTLLSVATKVAIQMNCKLGGEGWAVNIPSMTNAMVIGIDTYHDSAQKGRSVVGVVASLNKTFTRYYTRWGFQTTHQEMGSCLCDSITECVKAFQKVNGGNGPERVFLYRDGVGDGQLNMVIDFELPQIKKAFENAGVKIPAMAVLVVKKRINSRFFAPIKGEMTNPLPGTIVDSEATRPEWFDFFIVSQSVRQGTVTPTHYNVIENTTPLKADQLQRLTYKLCHLYFNWQGTVRVPAPCQYAHKVAFLIGQSLHESPSVMLADKLFYL